MAAPLAMPFERPDDAAVRRTALVEDPTAFAADTLALIGSLDSSHHSYIQALTSGTGTPTRDAHADLLHFLGILHGRQPSVIEVSAAGLGGRSLPPMDEWLAKAGASFEHERQWLAQLVIAAGPPAARAGLTAAEQVVRAQRDAMLTLAGSDRVGCAFGAAVALLIDWGAIRTLLSVCEEQITGSTTLPVGWEESTPSPALTHAALAASGQTAAMRRALLFGVTQMLTQHRALWDLLDARRTS